MSLPITDFLLARYAEEEDTARAATQGHWAVNAWGGVEAIVDGSVLYDVTARDGADVEEHGEEIEGHPQSTRDAEHIARHDPASVLAECEAKRRIVEMQAANDDDRYLPGFHYKAQMIERVLRALALPYADHPDYQPEWSL